MCIRDRANTVHDNLGVPVTYVVSNPSSYAYLDTTRPHADGSDFRAFTDGRNCTTYDASCPDLAQGRTRSTRGQAVSQYVKQKFGARHVLTELKLCGHNARCMF